MQFTHYKSRLQQMIVNRNGYLMLAALLAGISLSLAISLFRMVGREHIVIVPPVVNQAFWIEAHAVSPEYLSQMASFLAQLRFNLTPGSAVYQRDTLLQYTDPAYYGDLKNELVNEADQLEKNHTSLVFYPVDITVDVRNFTARISGDLKAIVGNDPLPVQRLSYRFNFHFSGGRLWLKSIEEMKNDHVEIHSKQE